MTVDDTASLLTRALQVRTLTIEGSLHWDTAAAGRTLAAGYVLVQGSGHLSVGTAAEPMEERATIYLKHNGASHPALGERFLGGNGGGDSSPTIEIHGRPLARTWSLLASDAPAGATSLHLKHGAAASGWRVGESIAIAATVMHQAGVPAESFTHTILGVDDAASTIEIAPPLMHALAGGTRDVSGHSIEIAAEVRGLLLCTTLHPDHRTVVAAAHN